MQNLELHAAADSLQALEEALWELGAVSVTLADAGDHPLHEPGPGETPVWPRARVRALFDDDADRERIVLALLARSLIDSPAAACFEALAERDWARTWMDRFVPMRFGENLWICPSHRKPDPDWPLVIRLDPGLAFGSGTHPTTALCLEWIDGADLSGRSVIDYGCGSGVLAVAAALKGAAPVLAIDHDPQALTATAENAAGNGVSERIRTELPEDAGDAPADVLIANILAGPLVDLAPRLAGRLVPGGRLVLSGILAGQEDPVMAAYRPWLDAPLRCQSREEWLCLTGVRRAGPARS